MLNLYISVSGIIIFILQLSNCPLNAFAAFEISNEDYEPPLPGQTTSWNSFRVGEITVHFSAPNILVPFDGVGGSPGQVCFNLKFGEESIEGNMAKECLFVGESEAVPTDDVHSRLQAHLVEKITKLMVNGKFLPQNFKADLLPDTVELFSGGSLEIKSPTSDPDRHASRSTREMCMYEEDMQRKNTVCYGMNSLVYEHVDDEETADERNEDEEEEDLSEEDEDLSEEDEDLSEEDFELSEEEDLREERDEFREEYNEEDGLISGINHEYILDKLGLLSYDEITGCSPSLENSTKSLLDESLPLSFYRYDCDKIFAELRHHQTTSMWSERVILEELFFSLLGLSGKQTIDVEHWKYHTLVQHHHWLSEHHHCSWGGVTCRFTTIGVDVGKHHKSDDVVAQHPSNDCTKSRLKGRHRNSCNGNRHLDEWTCEPCPPPDSVTNLDLTHMKFTGVLPDNLYMLQHLHRLNLMGNMIKGSIPATFKDFAFLEFLDVSKNFLSGSFPQHLPVSLTELWLEENLFSGTVPDSVGALTSLSYFDVSNNFLEGSLPSIIGAMTWMNSLYLRRNRFTGTIPEFLPTIHLRLLDLSHNYLEGTVPLSVSQFLYALEELDLSSNKLRGTLPPFPHNNRQLILNFSANEFTGEIPSSLCYGPYSSMFGCDAVMCKPGTFNPAGSASHLGPCRNCHDGEPFFGQTSCSSVEYLVGDINLDGVLSEREVLHLMFTLNDGFEWGHKYTESWSNFEIPACELPGIECEEKHVININLTDATMCSGYRKYKNGCIGLPTEIGLLSQLKSLDLGGPTAQLKGTIPSEIAALVNLDYLNLEESALKGSIPSEIASLESLRILNLQHCGLTGYLPPFGSVNSRLEVLNLALNDIVGSIPSSYGRLMQLEELILSRNKLTGTIIDFSRLKKLDNIELYGNVLRGSIPSSIEGCSGLKRIDLFSNALTGTIPSEFNNIPSLQIIHLKANFLTGTLPPSLLNNLPNFVWLDVSGNQITGTIPSSYGQSVSLKDLRLGGNKIHGEIAKELCNNRGLNDPPPGDKYGCDHILCPLGTYSEAGYATSLAGCEPCPDGQSTMHLGSESCRFFTQKDILKMLYELLDPGSNWDENYRRDWLSNTPECAWNGVTCEDGEVTGLSIPLSGLKM